MKLSEAIQYMPIIQAAKEGKAIQGEVEKGRWFVLDPKLADLRTFSPTELRIAHEPKLRPWKPEEVPVGARLKGVPPHNDMMYRAETTIVGVYGAWIIYPSLAETKAVSAKELFESGATHSLDNGKTWKPCGVEEAQ